LRELKNKIPRQTISARLQLRLRAKARENVFSQNADQRELLLATRGTTLVEASPHDRVWGSQWLGQNLLGEALTRVREVLIWEQSNST